MTLHRLTAENRPSMIGSADSPSQTNRTTRLAPTSFIGPVGLSAITLSPQAQSAAKSRRRASQKDSQGIRLASFCLRVLRSTTLNTERGLAGLCWLTHCRELWPQPMRSGRGRCWFTPSTKELWPSTENSDLNPQRLIPNNSCCL